MIMPITVGHEFTPEEINLIEGSGLTVAEVRDYLGRFSMNAEGSAEVELDTAIAGALMLKNSPVEAPLESALQNEVSEEVATEGSPVKDEEINVMPEISGSI